MAEIRLYSGFDGAESCINRRIKLLPEILEKPSGIFENTYGSDRFVIDPKLNKESGTLLWEIGLQPIGLREVNQRQYERFFPRCTITKQGVFLSVGMNEGVDDRLAIIPGTGPVVNWMRIFSDEGVTSLEKNFDEMSESQNPRDGRGIFDFRMLFKPVFVDEKGMAGSALVAVGLEFASCSFDELYLALMNLQRKGEEPKEEDIRTIVNPYLRIDIKNQEY